MELGNKANSLVWEETYTLKGSLGSEVKVILKVTFDVALQYMYNVYIVLRGHTPCEQGVATCLCNWINTN